jgi:(5-formylfuran-3-yl)methyl phosphate synthase
MSEKEAAEAIAGGADIIDVKNPKEGALGANYPWVIKRIKEITPKHLKVSCTLGEVPNLPGSISLAALGAASLGVDYIKVGLYGLKTPEDAVLLLGNVSKAVKDCNSRVKVAVAGYADAKDIGAIDPMIIPEVAKKSGADIAMLDTATKGTKNLFDYLPIKQLQTFVELSHSFGIEVALAGSLKRQDLPVVVNLGADIAGLRGAACINGDRVEGTITRQLVKELVEIVRDAEMHAQVERV